MNFVNLHYEIEKTQPRKTNINAKPYMKTKESKTFNGYNSNKGSVSLSWQQAQRLVEYSATQNRKLAVLFGLSLYLGLKVTELLEINTSEIIRKSVQVQRSKKTYKISIPNGFYKLMDKANINLKELNSKPFFSDKKLNSPITQRYINRKLKEYCIKFDISTDKIDRISTHSLRKTYGLKYYKQAQDKQKAITVLKEHFKQQSIKATYLYLGMKIESSL